MYFSPIARDSTQMEQHTWAGLILRLECRGAVAVALHRNCGILVHSRTVKLGGETMDVNGRVQQTRLVL